MAEREEPVDARDDEREVYDPDDVRCDWADFFEEHLISLRREVRTRAGGRIGMFDTPDMVQEAARRILESHESPSHIRNVPRFIAGVVRGVVVDAIRRKKVREVVRFGVAAPEPEVPETHPGAEEEVRAEVERALGDDPDYRICLECERLGSVMAAADSLGLHEKSVSRARGRAMQKMLRFFASGKVGAGAAAFVLAHHAGEAMAGSPEGTGFPPSDDAEEVPPRPEEPAGGDDHEQGDLPGREEQKRFVMVAAAMPGAAVGDERHAGDSDADESTQLLDAGVQSVPSVAGLTCCFVQNLPAVVATALAFVFVRWLVGRFLG